MSVVVITYGAIIRAVNVPDKEGNIQNVALGFENVEEYYRPGPYFGAVCGRFDRHLRSTEQATRFSRVI